MASIVPSSPVADFKRAVALEFATRPTLRQVAGQQVLLALVTRYPLIATSYPELESAEPLFLMVPNGLGGWRVEPLMDVVLQALLSGAPLDFSLIDGLDYRLSLAPPRRFYATESEAASLDPQQVVIRLEKLSSDFNEVLAELPEAFAQAQVAYWRASGSAQVSRDRWMQQTLRTALLRNLELQRLDEQEKACVYGLLKQGADTPSVFMVEALLDVQGARFAQRLPNLLVIGQWDERDVVLWCAPSSVIRAFASLELFAQALQQTLAEQYHFESISWNRYALEGDVFAQQSAVLLDGILDSLARIRYSPLKDVAQLEAAFATLTDPSHAFIAGYIAQTPVPAPALPDWLANASSRDRFDYQAALLDLGIDQAVSGGASALDGILDLHGFARERLRAQLLDDHPEDANYFPDDLILTVTQAQGVPGGAGVGAGDGVVQQRTMTLTEFAIGNLSSLQGATLSAIAHRDGQLIMDWMTIDYLKALIQAVDIGGHYPAYVAQKLDDPFRPVRIERFAREWRSTLLFSALKAKVQGTISEAGWQCVADYCRRQVRPEPAPSMLMPLAFKREPDASQRDEVTCMFVIQCVAPQVTLLYRPLYADSPLLEFVDLSAMMAAIRQPGPLQQSVLDWLKPLARPVYDFGGFMEPHLSRPIEDTSLLPQRVQPPSFAAQFWHHDVDIRLYMANRQLLVELADRQSVSNAESRWALLTQGAWLLFDVVTLLLRGPVATLAWMVQASVGLSNDLVALQQDGAFEKAQAVVDLILNAGMALFHARLPSVGLPEAQAPRAAVALDGPPRAWRGAGPAISEPDQGKVYLPGAFHDQASLHLDFSWRGAQGFNTLPPEQRRALRRMQSSISLDGTSALATGPGRGLHTLGGNQYVSLAGDVYQVRLTAQGVRVVGPGGEQGPWLAYEHGQWRVDASLRLRGGGPKRRVDTVRQQNQHRFEALQAQEATIVRQHNTLAKVFDLSTQALTEQKQNLEKLQALKQRTQEQSGAQALMDALAIKITRAEALVDQATEQTIADLRALIDVDIQLDSLLSEMAEPKHANQPLAPTIKRQRSRIRQELIDRSVVFYNEVVDYINKINVEHIYDGIAVRPESPEEVARYTRLREALENVVGLQADLLQVSARLDELLPLTLKDDDIYFIDLETNKKVNKDASLQRIMEQRRLTEIDLRFRQLVDVAELCLDRTAAVEEAVLIRFHRYLAGDSIKSACSAHAELAQLDVPLADRIDILTGILEEYGIAMARAQYLDSTGGAAVRPGRIKAYEQALATLTYAAERELAEAVREQEFAEPVIPKDKLYQQRQGRRRVVKTHSGRSVIGEELEVDGEQVVQQREAVSNNVLKTFHRQGEGWIETAASATVEEPASPAPVDVRLASSRARTVLGQVESVIALAKRYIRTDEPIGLVSVIEGHVEKLQEARLSVMRGDATSELGEQLAEGIERMQSVQRDLLTSLYLTTSHPTGDSLRYLAQEQQVRIQRSVQRKMLSATDYLDVYEIRRLPKAGKAVGEGLWEAHFHYVDVATPGRAFSKGHLKLWSQRGLGREAQLRAAATGHEMLAIYRGDLRLQQVDGIIPFD